MSVNVTVYVYGYGCRREALAARLYHDLC